MSQYVIKKINQWLFPFVYLGGKQNSEQVVQTHGFLSQIWQMLTFL
jgi:hypothetical protein